MSVAERGWNVERRASFKENSRSRRPGLQFPNSHIKYEQSKWCKYAFSRCASPLLMRYKICERPRTVGWRVARKHSARRLPNIETCASINVVTQSRTGDVCIFQIVFVRDVRIPVK